jgi:hypothetical protein
MQHWQIEERLWPENHTEWTEDIHEEALLIEAEASSTPLSDVDEAHGMQGRLHYFSAYYTRCHIKIYWYN